MVTRSALQNAASIAKNILTTEAIVVEAPEKDRRRRRRHARHGRHGRDDVSSPSGLRTEGRPPGRPSCFHGRDDRADARRRLARGRGDLRRRDSDPNGHVRDGRARMGRVRWEDAARARARGANRRRRSPAGRRSRRCRRGRPTRAWPRTACTSQPSGAGRASAGRCSTRSSPAPTRPGSGRSRRRSSRRTPRASCCTRRCGFRVVGRRERIGQLDGVWRDTLFLERRAP